MRVRSSLVGRSGLLAATLLASACATDPEPKGTLVLQVTSDMKFPADVDEVGLVVFRDGLTVVRQTVRVTGAPTDGKVPGTFAVEAGSDPDARLTFRVFASRDKTIRVTREAITAIPRGRTSYLQMPVKWLCEGDVDTIQNENGDLVPEDKRCPVGLTCDAGTCVTSEIPNETLIANLEPPAAPACVDAPACFVNGKIAALDVATCTLPNENGGAVNVALVLDKAASGSADGVCGTDACYILLDRADAGGWRVDNDKIVLPAAVCERVTAGLATGVAVVDASDGRCATKTPDLAICGPWSSPGGTGTTEAASPAGYEPSGAGGAGGEAGAAGASGEAGAAGAGGLAGAAGQAGAGGLAGAAGQAGTAGAGGLAGAAGQAGAGPCDGPNGTQDCNETDIDCGGLDVGLTLGRTCNVGQKCLEDIDCERGLACVVDGLGQLRCKRQLLCGDPGGVSAAQQCAAQYPRLLSTLQETTPACDALATGNPPYQCTISCMVSPENKNPVDGCECDGGADSLCNITKGDPDAQAGPMIVVFAARTGPPDTIIRLHPTLLAGTLDPYAPLFEMLLDDFVDGDLVASPDDQQVHFFGVLASGQPFRAKQPTKSLFLNAWASLPDWTPSQQTTAPPFLLETGHRPKISTFSAGKRSVTATTPMGDMWTGTDAGQSEIAPAVATAAAKNVRPAVAMGTTNGTLWAAVVDNGPTDKLILTYVPKVPPPVTNVSTDRTLKKGSSVAFFPAPDGAPRLVFLDQVGTAQVLEPSGAVDAAWTKATPLFADSTIGGWDNFALARPFGASSAGVSFVGLRHAQPGVFDELSVGFGAKDLPLEVAPNGPGFQSDIFDTPPTVVSYLDKGTLTTDLFVSLGGFVRDIRCKGTEANACQTTVEPTPLGMLHPTRLVAVAVPAVAP